MPAVAVPLIIAGISALGQWLSNRNRTQTSTQTSTLDPRMRSLQDMVMNQIQTRMAANPSGVPKGYEESGIKDINNTYNLVGQGMSNNLTARGLGTSPVAAGAETKLAESRAGDISRFQTDIPMAGRRFQAEDLAQAMQLLGQGRGLTSTTTLPGNAAGAGVNSLAQMMAFMYGMRGGGGAGGGMSALNMGGMPGYGMGANG